MQYASCRQETSPHNTGTNKYIMPARSAPQTAITGFHYCRGDAVKRCIYLFKCWRQKTFLRKPLWCDRCTFLSFLKKKKNLKLPFQTFFFYWNCSSILQGAAVSNPFLLIFLSSPSPLLWLPAIVGSLDPLADATATRSGLPQLIHSKSPTGTPDKLLSGLDHPAEIMWRVGLHASGRTNAEEEEKEE